MLIRKWNTAVFQNKNLKPRLSLSLVELNNLASIFGRARIDLYFIFVCYEYALWYHVMVILYRCVFTWEMLIISHHRKVEFNDYIK